MKTMISGTKGMAIAVVLGATVALGACKKSDTAATDTTATMAAAGDTSMNAANTGAMSSTAGTQAMTDASIFSMLGAANQGEIDAGKIAETKATNPLVRAFAKDMVTDHTMLLNQGDALAKKLNITPAPAANDSIMAMNKTMASTLNSTPKGMAFDSTYVNGQVMGHQQVLDMIKDAQGQAQNAELKTMLGTAEPIIQRHLDRIKDIQGKMK